MKSKERMMLALNGEIPDRVPATIHQWQPYHLTHQMKGVSDVEAFSQVGLDAAITYYEVADIVSSQWEVSLLSSSEVNDYTLYEYEVSTPLGKLRYRHGQNEMTSWVTDPLIKQPDDIYLIKKFRPIPRFDRNGFISKAEELGNDGIMRTFLWGYQGGPWQDACELVGLEKLIYASIDTPDWVHELLSILTDQKLSYIEKNLKDLPVDLVETGGGASSDTVISPEFHREFCLPYDRILHDALHDLGHRVVYHTCGGMKHLLDLLCENGADASETLSPTAIGGNLEEADYPLIKETLGSRLSLIGGIDQFHILPAENDIIKQEVRSKFETLGKGGGYIMSACDHFFELEPEKLSFYAKCARDCRY